MLKRNLKISNSNQSKKNIPKPPHEKNKLKNRMGISQITRLVIVGGPANHTIKMEKERERLLRGLGTIYSGQAQSIAEVEKTGEWPRMKTKDPQEKCNLQLHCVELLP